MQDFFYGSFNLIFEEENDTGYLAIHPEIYPADQGLEPSGNYFVYCIHPIRGSCTFILKQDKNCKWFSERRPSYIAEALINWFADRITRQTMIYGILSNAAL